jgi:hypothetical protein
MFSKRRFVVRSIGSEQFRFAPRDIKPPSGRSIVRVGRPLGLTVPLTLQASADEVIE